MSIEPRRAELRAWIAQTRRNQRILGFVIAGLVAISIALMMWRGDVGGIALAITTVIGFTGFWITAGHIADWRNKLAELDKPATLRVAGGGRRF